MKLLKQLFAKGRQRVRIIPIPRIVYTFLIAIPILLFFAAVIKGQKGNPIYYQTQENTQVGGPFETSNSTSRYALTESIVLRKTFLLSKNLAEFASPDVVAYKGKFISIFTPGVPFIGIPFYALGSLFKMPQFFTYLSTILFAVLNIFFITKLATKLGATYKAGLIAGCIFAFATNSLVYSLGFSQHIFSTSVILLALLSAFGKRNWKNNIFFGILFGTGILIDIPNAFFLVPVGLYILGKSISIEKVREQKQLILNTSIFGFIIGVIPLIAIFAWYNFQTTGSYTQLAQRIGRTNAFDKNAAPQLKAKEPSSSQPASFQLNLHLTFQTRPQLTGVYTLLLSDERSWIYYCPIVFVGILGLFLLYKKDETRGKALTIVSIIVLDVLLYSMFDDPWGGWAFGPRYLIPAAALLSLCIAPALDRLKKNPLFILIFGALLYYSLWVNFLGALTTSAIPPKIEALSLSTHIPYTCLYNQELIQKGLLGSLVYNLWLSAKIHPTNYWKLLVALAFGFFVMQYMFLLIDGKKVVQLVTPATYKKIPLVFTQQAKSLRKLHPLQGIHAAIAHYAKYLYIYEKRKERK